MVRSGHSKPEGGARRASPRVLSALVALAFAVCLSTAVGALLAWRHERSARLAVEDRLHDRLHARVVSRVAEGLDILDAASRRLLAFDRAAITAGILDPGDSADVARFFRQQLQDFEHVGYVGLLHLTEPLSGTAVRRTELGPRVEEVTFQAATSRLDPFPGRRRYSFRLDEAGRRRSVIRELGFNPPWDDALARAMASGRQGNWRSLFIWALGEAPPSIHVEKVTAADGRPIALLGVAPSFEALDLEPFRGVAVLDAAGRVVARSADVPEAFSRLRGRLPEQTHPTEENRILDTSGAALRITPWWRPATVELGATASRIDGRSEAERARPGLWIATIP